MPTDESPLADAIPARMSRRDMFGFAARGAATVIVSQSLMGCGADAFAGVDTAGVAGTAGTTGQSARTGCVLTAALTEGPYLVDEKLARSDIRADPTSGAPSARLSNH